MYLALPAEEVSQGDIFDGIPVAYLRHENPSEPSADIRFVRAILVSHDCEYDKPSNQFVLVAEVRPLTEIPGGSQGNVRHYRTRNTFYLEPLGELMPESYVDFRRIDRIQKVTLEQRNQA